MRDVAEGMVRAMERGRPGRRYLLGHENLSIREVFARLARLTGLPEPTLARAVRPSPWRRPTSASSSPTCVTHRPPAATVTGVKLTRRRMHFDARRQPGRNWDSSRGPSAQSLAERWRGFANRLAGSDKRKEGEPRTVPAGDKLRLSWSRLRRQATLHAFAGTGVEYPSFTVEAVAGRERMGRNP